MVINNYGDKNIALDYWNKLLTEFIKRGTIVVGVVYKYTLKTECPQKGYSYIGETTYEKGRRYDWNESNTKYAGNRINNARLNYGVSTISTWEYEVIEYVYASSKKELKKKLRARERFYIDKYDSKVKGFNSR